MSTRTRRGRPAVTQWKVIERFDGLTLLEILPETGRTHQIRVHLSALGHPILGDPLYGKKRSASGSDIKRMFSEDSTVRPSMPIGLGFLHPRTGERVEFVSPIPKDISEVLDWLRMQKA